MKKIIAGLLVVLCALSLPGCGKKNNSRQEREQTDSKTYVVVEDSSEKKVETETEERNLSIAEVRKACQPLEDDISNYEYVAVLESNLSRVGEQKTINLNDKEKTRAAGLACDVSNEEAFDLEILDTGEFRILQNHSDSADCSGVELSEEEVNQKCQAMFGKKASLASLASKGNAVSDVVRLNNGRKRIVSLWGNFETDTDFIVNDSTVKKGKQGYLLKQNIYVGHWGYSNLGKSNYQITCGVKKSKESEYGFVIYSMNVRRIADEYTWKSEEEAEEPVNLNTPFYGIWCYGVKDASQADSYAEKVSAKGFDGRVFVSSDWDNLNPEKWYVITAGVYDTEQEAKDALKEVKAAGYTDAYVKYSGEYIGN